MAAHSSILAWRILWTEVPRSTVHGVARVGHDLVTKPTPFENIKHSNFKNAFTIIFTFISLLYFLCVKTCLT